MEDAGFRRELSDFPLSIDLAVKAVPKKSVAAKKYKKKSVKRLTKTVVNKKKSIAQRKKLSQVKAKMRKVAKKRPAKKTVRSKKHGKATKSKALSKRRPTSIAPRRRRI